MVFSPFSVIVVSPVSLTGVVMVWFSQVTSPEMVPSVLAAAAIRGVACSVPLQAERSASSAEQMGQSGLSAPCSQWVSQLHSAGAFPDTPDTSVSTADAGTPGIVKIIAAASKHAAGRFHFHFHFILFILLTLFVPSRCFLKQLGYCLPQLIFRHRLHPKVIYPHPAALGFKFCLIADP